ncbi:MAG: hypothetical protein AB8C46_02770 [Burkholderiaceae bacterium]
MSLARKFSSPASVGKSAAIVALCSSLVSPAVSLACSLKNPELAIEAVFIEGAPIDRLLVTNQSEDGWSIEQVTWDLAPSAGQVIFDTTATGAGVEVFQPFRQLNANDTRRAGGQLTNDDELAVLASEPTVTDGDQSVAIDFKTFGAQQVFGMSIDVDDQIASRQTIVDRSEMQGATIQAVFVHESKSARTLVASFDDNAKASSCEASMVGSASKSE